MVDPLSLVHYLFCQCGLGFQDSQVEQYWSHYRSREIQADWAMWSDASNRHIPIGVYGDGCKLRQGEKMMGIFLSFPLFRPRSIRTSRFLLTCVQEEVMVGRKTLDCMWRQVIWACNVLFVGKWPATGPDGEQVTGKRAQTIGQDIVPNKQFCVTEIRGDWLWFKQCFQFKSSWKGGANLPICFACEARSIEPNLYYNIGEDSVVWTTEHDSVVTFLAKQMPDNPSIWARILIFVCQLFFSYIYACASDD